MYSKRLRNRMLSADRLKRTKQILEATAVIGQTLKDVVEQNLTADKAAQSDESVVEGSFRVVDPDRTHGNPTARAGDQPEIEVTIIPPPKSEQQKSSHQSTSGAAGSKTTAEAKQPEVEVEINTSDETNKTNKTNETKSEQANTQSSPSWTDWVEQIAEQLGGGSQKPGSSPFGDEMPLFVRIPEQLRQFKDKIPFPQTPFESSETETETDGPGRFLRQSYTNDAGTRSYKLYIPSGYQGQSLPLVVMLHGCTQSPDDFAASTRMNELGEKHSFLVAYPEQTFKANFGKCWNWFKASEQQRDQGEPAIIAGITRQVIKEYNIDTRRVYIAGISAGGAMSMVMGMTHPDLYAATGIQSGVPYAVANNIPTGIAAIKMGGSVSSDQLTSAPGDETRVRVVPTIVFHGDEDSMVNPTNGDGIIGQWMQVRAEKESNQPAPKVTTHRGQVPGGHSYTRSVYQIEGEPPIMEQWLVHGAGHAWSGGNPNIAWTDGRGPDASQEMLRFFFEHPHPEA